MRKFLVAVMGLGLAAAPRAEAWELTELPAPPPGWNVSPRAINDAGQIAGEYHMDDDWVSNAFLFDGATWKGLGTLGGESSYGWGLNDRGEVVGESETTFSSECYTWPDGQYCIPEVHAFVYRGGALHDLGVQGSYSAARGINNAGVTAGNGTSFAQSWSRNAAIDVFGTFGGTCQFSSASAINGRGQVVGYASTIDGSHAFLYDPRTGLHDLGTLGGPTSTATAISDAGHVVGVSDTADVTGCVTNEWGSFCEYERHAFLWKDGEMIDLGTLGGPYATPRGVTLRGEVVGESDTSEKLRCWVEGGMERCSYRIHAFVWADGEMVDLGAAGRTSFATGINQRGQIVGVAEMGPGAYRPVIWRR